MFALVQWFNEGQKGRPGLLNKLKCKDIFDVPKGTIQVGAKEFMFNSKNTVENLYNPDVFKLGKWKQKLLCLMLLLLL